MIDSMNQKRDNAKSLAKVIELFKTVDKFDTKFNILDELRTLNNPMLLYSLKSSYIYHLSLMLDPERLQYEFPIEKLRETGRKGVDLYSEELIVTEDATDQQIYDNLIISYLFPVIRLSALAVNRMTPAIRNEIIAPGEIGWSELKALVERWDDIDMISRIIDAGAIRPISSYHDQSPADATRRHKGSCTYSDPYPGLTPDERDVVRFDVLIKSLREMNIGRCSALAESYKPEVLDHLKKLDIEITEFFRNR